SGAAHRSAIFVSRSARTVYAGLRLLVWAIGFAFPVISRLLQVFPVFRAENSRLRLRPWSGLGYPKLFDSVGLSVVNRPILACQRHFLPGIFPSKREILAALRSDKKDV